MSRLYEMRITISDLQPDNLNEVKRNVEGQFGVNETSWDDWEEGDGRHVSEYVAIDQLCGAETEEAFSTRIAGEVWAGNGGYCGVVVSALCLEDLPRENHARGRDHFDLWAESAKRQLSEQAEKERRAEETE